MASTLTFATGPVQLDDDGAHLRRELGRALSEALGASIEVVAEASYASLSERVMRGEAALAWLPPATFVRASEGGTVERVFSSERAYGARYQAALFVRADGPVTDLDALAGKRVAWVDRDSCAGYLFPKLELLERGRPPDSLFVSQRFLESVTSASPSRRFFSRSSSTISANRLPNSAWRSASTSRACTMGSIRSRRSALASSRSSLAFASGVTG